jgi:hypothetical protein
VLRNQIFDRPGRVLQRRWHVHVQGTGAIIGVEPRHALLELDRL